MISYFKGLAGRVLPPSPGPQTQSRADFWLNLSSRLQYGHIGTGQLYFENLVKGAMYNIQFIKVHMSFIHIKVNLGDIFATFSFNLSKLMLLLEVRAAIISGLNQLAEC